MPVGKQDEFTSLKEGVKLPKSLEDWCLTDLYFHSELSSINIKNNLNKAMILTNSTVYNYFRDNYGYKNTISEEEINLKERYKNLSRTDLKKESKTLKLNNASINIIKYVAKEIRSRINKNPISIAVVTGNDDETSRNFWGYAKKIFRSGTAVLPSFGVVQGTTNFTNTLKCVNLIPFNLSPPTFQEINELSSA